MRNDEGRMHAGVLLFDGVELLDFAGPAEVFGIADEGKRFRVVTVAETRRTVRAMGGVGIVPSCSFDDAPQLDVLVVPGGAMGNVSDAGIAVEQAAHARTKVTMSVCMGAFLLARAGLLDGIDATTHHWGLEDLRRAAPTCRVVPGVRFVDSGRIVTTAGVTAGIDGALHVLARLCGEESARWAADEWMEHPSA